jgi:hypothetical protein
LPASAAHRLIESRQIALIVIGKYIGGPINPYIVNDHREAAISVSGFIHGAAEEHAGMRQIN